jgi:hypothetical protein
MRIKERRANMCEHKRIKSVNCELFCLDCGEKLSEAVVFAQKSAKNHGDDQSAGKTTGRKRNAKNAEKTA